MRARAPVLVALLCAATRSESHVTVLIDDVWTTVEQGNQIGTITTLESYKVSFDMRLEDSFNLHSTAWHSIVQIGSSDSYVCTSELTPSTHEYTCRCVTLLPHYLPIPARWRTQ